MIHNITYSQENPPENFFVHVCMSAEMKGLVMKKVFEKNEKFAIIYSFIVMLVLACGCQHVLSSHKSWGFIEHSQCSAVCCCCSCHIAHCFWLIYSYSTMHMYMRMCLQSQFSCQKFFTSTFTFLFLMIIKMCLMANCFQLINRRKVTKNKRNEKSQ